MADVVGQIKYDARIDTSQLARDGKKADAIVKASGDNIESTADRSFGHFSTVAKAGLAAVSAAVVASTVLWGKHLVDVASEIQGMRASFESMTGSAESANKVMSELNKFSFKTAFSTAEINAAARTLLGAGARVEDLGGYMQWLGDVAGATGADLGRLTLPISQAMARGKLQTQDFYQILDSGAGKLGQVLREKLAQRGMGDFTKAMEEGKVTSDILFETLKEASNEGGFAFQGAIKQSETFKGRVSNLKETIDNVGLAILGVDKATGTVKAGGVFDSISKSVEGLKNWLDTAGPGIENAFRVIGDVIKKIGDAIAPLTDYIKNNETAWNFLKTLLMVIGAIIGGLIIGLFVSLVAIVAVVTAVIQGVVWVAGKLADGLIWLGNKIAGVIWWFYEAGEAFGAFAYNAWNTLTRTFGRIGKWFSDLGSDMWSAGRDIISGLINGISNGKNAVIAKIKEIAAGALDAIKKFFGIHSPSRVMAQMGDYMMQGWGMGMDRSSGRAINAATSASQDVLGAFGGGVVSPSISPDFAAGGGSNGRQYNINSIVISKEVDGERWLRKLTGNQEIVSAGLVPTQEYGGTYD